MVASSSLLRFPLNVSLSGQGRDTFSRRIYKSIRLAMLNGKLQPGSLHSEAGLALTLGASRTPIREALRQLESEGLVEIMPQRGFRLRTMTLADVREFYALREMLETYAVSKLCNEPITNESLDGLALILDRQRSCIHDVGEFIAWDEEFHIALAVLAELPRTARIISSLRGILWLLGTQIIGAEPRRKAVLNEHSEIMAGVLRRDRTAAATAMRRHIRETARLALKAPAVVASKRVAEDSNTTTNVEGL